MLVLGASLAHPCPGAGTSPQAVNLACTLEVPGSLLKDSLPGPCLDQFNLALGWRGPGRVSKHLEVILTCRQYYVIGITYTVMLTPERCGEGKLGVPTPMLSKLCV